MSGTVNISRKIWDDAAFKSEPFTEREAFMWMIMEASYKPREKRVDNVPVYTDRGQLATSVRFMAEAWGWSKSRVDRYLKRLEKRDMIGTHKGTRVNLITICKYGDYQNKPKNIGTSDNLNRNNSGTTAGQQRDKHNKGVIPDAIKSEDTDVSSKSDGDTPPRPIPVNDHSEAVSIYNEAAERVGWPRVQKLTKARAAALKGRLEEAGGIEGWRYAVEAAEKSDFLSGRNGKWTGCTFDWISKQGNFIKVMEGNYDNKPEQQAGQGGSGGRRLSHRDRMQRIISSAARGSTG